MRQPARNDRYSPQTSHPSPCGCPECASRMPREGSPRAPGGSSNLWFVPTGPRPTAKNTPPSASTGESPAETITSRSPWRPTRVTPPDEKPLSPPSKPTGPPSPATGTFGPASRDHDPRPSGRRRPGRHRLPGKPANIASSASENKPSERTSSPPDTPAHRTRPQHGDVTGVGQVSRRSSDVQPGDIDQQGLEPLGGVDEQGHLRSSPAAAGQGLQSGDLAPDHILKRRDVTGQLQQFDRRHTIRGFRGDPVIITSMSFVVDDSDLLTTRQAAELVGRQPDSVKRALNNGVIPGRRVDGFWRVRREDVLAWDARARRQNVQQEASVRPGRRNAGRVRLGYPGRAVEVSGGACGQCPQAPGHSRR